MLTFISEVIDQYVQCEEEDRQKLQDELASLLETVLGTNADTILTQSDSRNGTNGTNGSNGSSAQTQKGI